MRLALVPLTGLAVWINGTYELEHVNKVIRSIHQKCSWTYPAGIFADSLLCIVDELTPP